MNIYDSTRSFEGWLASAIPLVRGQLASKHQQMAQDPFIFLRGTFYRWAQKYPEVCSDLAKAPKVLALGDVHVASFGTWRDALGRLVWGVDDFDEAYPLPYTSDLVRLATGAALAIFENHLAIDWKEACDAILEGYRDGLKAGGRPFVLEEDHQWLRSIALNSLDEPARFWKKMDNLAPAKKPVPAAALEAVKALMPAIDSPFRVVRRQAGVGSLGHPRYVAISECHGGQVALEAKEAVPSACAWAANSKGTAPIHYQEILRKAVRCPDPYVALCGKWVVRRLAPDSSPIEIEQLPKERPEDRLLHAMGWETANVHLGSRRAVKALRKHLQQQPAGWLRSGTKAMVKATLKDWKNWNKGAR